MFNFALKFLVRMCFSRRLKGNQEKYDFGSTKYEARSFLRISNFYHLTLLSLSCSRNCKLSPERDACCYHFKNHCSYLEWEGKQQDASQETCQNITNKFLDFRDKSQSADEKNAILHSIPWPAMQFACICSKRYN